MNFGLSKETTQLLGGAFLNFPLLEKVWLFGSRAKGNFRENSDVDLAVKFSQKSSTHLIDLMAALDDLPLLYKFDVVDIDSAEDQGLLAEIKEFGVVVCEGTIIQ